MRNDEKVKREQESLQQGQSRKYFRAFRGSAEKPDEFPAGMIFSRCFCVTYLYGFTAIIAFLMLLRDSPYKGKASIPMVMQLARDGKGADPDGYREEFIGLVRKADPLMQIRK